MMVTDTGCCVLDTWNGFPDL